MKINWKQKLSSRKFWALLTALAVSLLTALGAGANTVEKTTGVIGSVSACLIYMLSESIVDAAQKKD